MFGIPKQSVFGDDYTSFRSTQISKAELGLEEALNHGIIPAD